MPEAQEVIIIGAGAAGMMCALTAAQRGRAVLLLDHAEKLAEKIRISGGGRCNFTNLHITPENYLSQNPHFCRSALARFTPLNFIALLKKHGVGFHEKTLGQMFCDESSEAIITMLMNECDEVGVRWCNPCEVYEIKTDYQQETAGQPEIKYQTHRYTLATSRGAFQTRSLVIATGGLSIPKIGATSFGYKIAQQFGIPVTHLKPGLVPLSFHPEVWDVYAGLAGISVDAIVSFGKQAFRENLLFTHRGLSGPAILQVSSYWEHGQNLSINLLPAHDMHQLFAEQHGSRMLLSNFLASYLPKRLADAWCGQFNENKPLNQYSEKVLAGFATQLHNWQITPTGTLGYGKAEVTCGGIDTRALSSKTMQATNFPGMYFIGEVVDVTGQLGGYNFQWAWASGYAAGQSV
jgi:predicted Rossmann fold flavoprotein